MQSQHLLALLVLAACGTSEPDVIEGNPEYKQLVDGYDTLDDCERANQNQGFAINCLRTLTLCANGGFVLVVTDIVNEGRYTRDGNAITAKLEGSGDAPSTFSLQLTETGFESTELAGRHPWQRDTASTSGTSCESLEGRHWW